MSTWKYKRLFEILPGACSWTIILLPIILSFVAPKVLATYMIFFLSYWLVKTFFMSYRLIVGYKNYRHDQIVDWRKKLDNLAPQKSWQDIYHLVVVPTYKEDISILESSLESVVNSDFPSEKVIYVLATEERDKERAEANSSILKKKYQDKLADFISIMHPKDLPEEVIGKGPNITYAGQHMISYFQEKGIPFENVIVTNMDADNLMDKKYLSCLTYCYLTDPDPVYKSFQPLPMYFNNIWDVPMPMRLIAMGSSFWQMIVATRPSRLRNFSAHAQSLEALIKVDFWSKTTIVEDGHQFWRTYFSFDGRHEVVPMYVPIYQDAVLAGSLWDTMKEQYLQKKRWAWGASDIPFVMEHTIGNKNIPFIDRWANALILLEAHITWATTSIVLATSSWLPLVLNPEFRNTVLAFNFPIIYARLLTIAWVGMITTLIISSLLVPPHQGKKPSRRIFFDWILTPLVLPISNIIFSSLPALESQTRLMLGKYLGYRVTVKSTKRSFASDQ
ncbi:MAG: glycosyltransferase family 2 protein [Patescibacteria group bacterium]|jgi:cellulose synthase/poly-beta-1,6-N-acetylglucosamine synthase-like glycosyltransferase